jgi:antitoxin MazE
MNFADTSPGRKGDEAIEPRPCLRAEIEAWPVMGYTADIREGVMRVKIAKWGNSVAVRLPREACERYGLVPGSEADLAFAPTYMALTPAEPPITIETLVSRSRAAGGVGNYPREIVDWGPDVGAERIDG